jgi:hypothetical protein
MADASRLFAAISCIAAFMISEGQRFDLAGGEPAQTDHLMTCAEVL